MMSEETGIQAVLGAHLPTELPAVLLRELSLLSTFCQGSWCQDLVSLTVLSSCACVRASLIDTLPQEQILGVQRG